MGEFGAYMKALRLSRGYTMRGMAKEMGVSAQYLSEVEKGRSKITADRLKEFAACLHLTTAEMEKLYDLSACEDSKAPQDCVDYLYDNPLAMQALRLAKRDGNSDAEWQKMIDTLKKKLEKKHV